MNSESCEIRQAHKSQNWYPHWRYFVQLIWKPKHFVNLIQRRVIYCSINYTTMCKIWYSAWGHYHWKVVRVCAAGATSFFQARKRSLAYRFPINIIHPSCAPHFQILEKIAFSAIFGQNFGSQEKKFQNFFPKTPHFSRNPPPIHHGFMFHSLNWVGQPISTTAHFFRMKVHVCLKNNCQRSKCQISVKFIKLFQVHAIWNIIAVADVPYWYTILLIYLTVYT